MHLVTLTLSHSVISYDVFNYWSITFVSDMDIIFGLGQISIVGDIMLEAFIA